MNEILKTLNGFIREEHGNTVTIESMWKDTMVDSFGTTMVFCDMDTKYECFNKDWLNAVQWETLTIRDIVERVQNESTKL